MAKRKRVVWVVTWDFPCGGKTLHIIHGAFDNVSEARKLVRKMDKEHPGHIAKPVKFVEAEAPKRKKVKRGKC